MAERRGFPYGIAAGVAMAIGAALVLFQVRQRRLDAAVDVLPPPAQRSETGLVADELAGWRPAPNAERRTAVRTLDGTARAVVRHTDDHGFAGRRTHGSRIPGPRVLLLGDEQLGAGVEDGERAGALLEERLRAHEGMAEATVLDAGCEGHGLWQHALRGADLIRRYRPRAVVLVVSCGDDLAVLDDRRRPHLDRAAVPQLADANAAPLPAPELEPGARSAFGHGPQQAWLAQRERTRIEGWATKARTALELLAGAAQAQRAHLLAVLLPAADELWPDALAAAHPALAGLLHPGVQAELRAACAAALADARIGSVDLTAALRAEEPATQWTTAGVLAAAGHRVLAGALAPRVADLLWHSR